MHGMTGALLYPTSSYNGLKICATGKPAPRVHHNHELYCLALVICLVKQKQKKCSKIPGTVENHLNLLLISVLWPRLNRVQSCLKSSVVSCVTPARQTRDGDGILSPGRLGALVPLTFFMSIYQILLMARTAGLNVVGKLIDHSYVQGL